MTNRYTSVALEKVALEGRIAEINSPYRTDDTPDKLSDTEMQEAERHGLRVPQSVRPIGYNFRQFKPPRAKF
jgi:hypothetical protein